MRLWPAIFAISLGNIVPVQAMTAGNGLIFAAASLKGPLDRAVALIGEQERCLRPGAKIRVSYASSGILARQIGFGAPADLFISADTRWVDYLARRGRIVDLPAARRVLFANRLVLIGHRSQDGVAALEPGSAAALRLRRERLAIGDPAHVPAGRYTKAALRSLGLWQQAQRNMILAANVRFATAYVARREVPLGIVYETDAVAEPRVGVIARIPESAHPPIRYHAAIVAGGAAGCARHWLDALEKPTYRKLFTDAGYRLP